MSDGDVLAALTLLHYFQAFEIGMGMGDQGILDVFGLRGLQRFLQHLLRPFAIAALYGAVASVDILLPKAVLNR